MDLYIKVICACGGKRKTWYGMHCPYCTDGKMFAKITNQNLINYILKFEKEEREEILKELLKDAEDKRTN